MPNFHALSQQLNDAMQIQLEHYSQLPSETSPPRAKRAYIGNGDSRTTDYKRPRTNLELPAILGGKRSDGKYSCPGHDKIVIHTCAECRDRVKVEVKRKVAEFDRKRKENRAGPI
jgi:hypothetical protein